MSKSSAWVFDVTEADFDEKVLKKSHEVPVVVDFGAPWCGPCRSLAPIIERLVSDRQGAVLLAKLNIDEAQNLAMTYGAEAIPHVVAFRKGRPFLQFTGLLPEAQLMEFLDRLAPSEAEKEAESAAQLEESNPAEAERLYRAALAKDRYQTDAMLGLARSLIAQKKEAEATEVLDQIGPGGEAGAAADGLRARLWLQIEAKQLPDEEALRQKVKAEPQNGQALCDLGCVLAANGKTAEALETLFQAGRFDRKLASSRVREIMVKIFFIIGVRSELADAYRDKLTALLY